MPRTMVKWALRLWGYDRECSEDAPNSAAADRHEHIGWSLLLTQFRIAFNHIKKFAAQLKLEKGPNRKK